MGRTSPGAISPRASTIIFSSTSRSIPLGQQAFLRGPEAIPFDLDLAILGADLGQLGTEFQHSTVQLFAFDAVPVPIGLEPVPIDLQPVALSRQSLILAGDPLVRGLQLSDLGGHVIVSGLELAIGVLESPMRGLEFAVIGLELAVRRLEFDRAPAWSSPWCATGARPEP